MEVRSETGVVANREPFSVGMQKPTVQSPPSMHNMRLTFTPDGTAVYKPIATSSPPPQPPSYQGGGGVGASGGGGGNGPTSGGPTGGGNGPSPAIPPPHGLSINMGEPVKRKRGRPRKYGPDGTMALALIPVSPPSAGPPTSGAGGFSPSSASGVSGSADAMKKRGRPPGSGRKMQMAALGSASTGFTPHVITVKTGEVISKQLFDVLREKHREEFNSFITEKVSPIAGDITIENLGIRDTDLRETLWNKIDIVMNVAATTNFYERYDVALNINVLGAKHVLEFAKKCPKLELLLHVSTAYVAGVREGIILEKAFHMGETLKGGFDLDIEKELKLVEEKKRELYVDNNAEKDVQRSAMKELGLQRAKTFGWPNTYVFTKAMGEMLLGHLRGDLPLVILRPTIITSIYKEPLPGWIEGTRTIDSLIIGYVKGKLPCFFGDQELIMDVIPGDMVVNCMIFAITYHLNQRSQFIYHICSSTSNPVKYTTLERCGFKYFTENPRIGKNGEPIKTRRIPVFKKMYLFRAYMALRYWLPLELFSEQYSMLSRKYKFVMRLVDLYEPYAYFRGCFDDINTEYLRMAMAKENSKDSKIFDFDPNNINWEDYLYDVHIPGVLKYVCK